MLKFNHLYRQLWAAYVRYSHFKLKFAYASLPGTQYVYQLVGVRRAETIEISSKFGSILNWPWAMEWSIAQERPTSFFLSRKYPVQEFDKTRYTHILIQRFKQSRWMPILWPKWTSTPQMTSCRFNIHDTFKLNGPMLLKLSNILQTHGSTCFFFDSGAYHSSCKLFCHHHQHRSSFLFYAQWKIVHVRWHGRKYCLNSHHCTYHTVSVLPKNWLTTK